MRTAVVDLEASKFNELGVEASDKIDLVGFYDGDYYYNFNCVDEFIDFLHKNADKYNRFKIFAHNGGKYDFLFILNSIKNNKLLHNLRRVIIKGGIIAFDYVIFKNGKQFVVSFRDSYKLLPSSLEKLGASFGFPKLKMEDCKTYEDLIHYNKNDCIILYNIIHEFVRLSKLKRIPLTAPSFAINKFLEFNKVKSVSQIIEPADESFTRKAYVGGRVEVFKRDVENYVCVDVNSLYPYVMRENYYPVGKPVEVFDDEAERCFRLGKLGAYQVEWVAPDIYAPVLWEKVPIKNNITKLMFRVNRDKGFTGSGIYTYPELKVAYDEGYRLSFKRAIIYEDKEKLFEDFVDEFYKMKLKGGAYKEIAKIILNSCYGKLGQRSEVSELVITNDLEDVKKKAEIFFCNNAVKTRAGGLYPLDVYAGLYYAKKSIKLNNINVLLAGMITAYARSFLYTSMKRVGFSMSYVDTDSMFIPEEYLKNIETDDEELGKWKIEKYINRGRFYAPKTYILETKKGLVCKAKGIPYNVITKLSSETFENCLSKMEMLEFEAYGITQFRQALRMKLDFGQVRKFKKVLTLNYDKRIFLEDGSSVAY